MTKSMVVRIAIAAALVFYVALGVWPFFSPRSFYDALATFPPYNAHFLRDIGAFTIGIGAGVLAALRWRDALTATLAGAAAASTMHVISHVVDRDLGGKPTDIPLLSLLAIVIAAGLVARIKEVTR
ncbi:MAG: pyridoxamine 5'-phosphate oxidase [Actinomycetota bacterium]